MKNGYLTKLASLGFSIIPCNENKVPIGQWKNYRENPRTIEQIQELDSPLYGILTGVDGLEVIDVDTKILPSLQDRKEFWDEFYQMLKDNIDDFEDKFVIKKTISGGYHILYKCEEIQGNTKIAKLKGYSESIIESRG